MSAARRGTLFVAMAAAGVIIAVFIDRLNFLTLVGIGLLTHGVLMVVDKLERKEN